MVDPFTFLYELVAHQYLEEFGLSVEETTPGFIRYSGNAGTRSFGIVSDNNNTDEVKELLLKGEYRKAFIQLPSVFGISYKDRYGFAECTYKRTKDNYRLINARSNIKKQSINRNNDYRYQLAQCVTKTVQDGYLDLSGAFASYNWHTFFPKRKSHLEQSDFFIGADPKERKSSTLSELVGAFEQKLGAPEVRREFGVVDYQWGEIWLRVLFPENHIEHDSLDNLAEKYRRSLSVDLKILKDTGGKLQRREVYYTHNKELLFCYDFLNMGSTKILSKKEPDVDELIHWLGTTRKKMCLQAVETLPSFQPMQFGAQTCKIRNGGFLRF